MWALLRKLHFLVPGARILAWHTIAHCYTRKWCSQNVPMWSCLGTAQLGGGGGGGAPTAVFALSPPGNPPPGPESIGILTDF